MSPLQVTTRKWLHGLAAAVIGAAASGVSGMLVDPNTFNLSQAGLLSLGKLVIANALIAAALYLKQSPLPPEQGE